MFKSDQPNVCVLCSNIDNVKMLRHKDLTLLLEGLDRDPALLDTVSGNPGEVKEVRDLCREIKTLGEPYTNGITWATHISRVSLITILFAQS